MSDNLPEVRNVTDLQQGQGSPDELRQRMQRMTEMIALKQEFLKNNLKEGIEGDYAVVPGCGNKKVLLKPGAEKLLDWNGYYPHFTLVSEKEDWVSGIFAYVYRCEVKQRGSNILIADAEGDASTMESKYRYEWKFGSQIPEGVDHKTLTKREVGKNKTPMYRVVVDNPADKRNTVRKMAQKRALMGATVLATATSSLFATDLEPDDGDDGGQGGNGDSDKGNGNTTYGEPIGRGKKSGALYYKLKEAKIDEKDFNAWLKASYGWDNKDEIGEKAFEEIINTVKTGKLPAPKPKAEKPATSPDVKVGVDELRNLAEALKRLDKKEASFTEWLAIAYPQYEGTNDILAADYPMIIAAFEKAVAE